MAFVTIPRAEAVGSCPICLASFDDPASRDPVAHPVGAIQHIFHRDCLNQWIHTVPEHPTCPVCKGDIVQIDQVAIHYLLQDAELRLWAPALLVAAVDGDLAEVRRILAEEDTTANQVGRAILAAVKHDFPLIIRELIQRETHAPDIGFAVLLAANLNRIDAMQELLIREIPYDYRGGAIVSGAKNNRLDIVALLLPDGVKIPQECRDLAFRYAASHDNRAMFELLLANGPISQADQAAVIEDARTNHHPEIEEWLQSRSCCAVI